MNQPTDLDHLLDRWLADGPTEAPDRVIHSVADRIERQPQRPAWRLLWREIHVNAYLKPLAAVVAVVAIAFVAFNLLAGSSRPAVGAPGVSPTAAAAASPFPSPSTSPSSEPSATTAWWLGDGQSCDPCLGELAAGSHTSTAFKPALTYTVPTGWINHYDGQDGFGLLPDTPANRSYKQTGTVTLQDLTLIRDVAAAAVDCSDGPEPGIGLRAADIIGALSKRPGLDATKPVDVTIGGLSGKQIDVSLAHDAKNTCSDSDGQPSVPLIKYAGQGAHWGASAGNRFRLIVLDVPKTSGGGTILIDILSANAAAFDRHLAAAMRVVDTFTFGLTP